MCTVGGDYDEAREFLTEKESRVLDGALCQKCNSERALVVLRGKDVYCNSCFLASATHKFRATLGKSKIVRPTDTILVAHSGNAGSTALLHLIRAGMHESVHKRLVFKTKVLYIDDGAVKGQSLEDRKTRLLGIERQTKALEFETHAAPLTESLKEEPDVRNLENFAAALSDISSDDGTLTNIFDKLADYTSKIELLNKLRQRLIFSSARKLGCTKIFVADDATSLAIKILSNVSLGRGAQLSLDVSFVDNRYSDIILLRPMRDFSRHELATYLDIKNLETVASGDLADSTKSPPSIQRLTEKFVTDLESKFSGTVSTVFRTGEKVCAGASTKNRDADETCVLCDAPLDTLASDNVISAIQATTFSHLVSSRGLSEDLDLGKVESIANLSAEENRAFDGCGKCNETGSCEKSGKDADLNKVDNIARLSLGEDRTSDGCGKCNGTGSCEKSGEDVDLSKAETIANLSLEENRTSDGCGRCNGTGSCGKSGKAFIVSSEDLRRFLCYGCRLIFKNSETDDVPSWMLNAVRQRLSLENMREEITDFLL